MADRLISKEELLMEWDDLTDSYNKRGIMDRQEESFMAGQIVEVEDLLSEFFKIRKEFFG